MIKKEQVEKLVLRLTISQLAQLLEYLTRLDSCVQETLKNQ